MNVDTATLRQFINDHFGPQDLNDLLFDYFRSVHEDVTPGMTKRQQISLLLEFCHRHNQMENLLAAVSQMRPFFQPDDYVQGRKAPTAAPLPPAPITRNPRQIFISHAHQDAEVAQRLAHDLEAHGYDIWIAPDSIRPGEKWVEAINRGLEESGIFVLLLSPDAVDSRWVNMETNAAIEFDHEGQMQFYPLMFKECRMPALWRAFHYISFLQGYELGIQILINNLKPEDIQDTEMKEARSSFRSDDTDSNLVTGAFTVDPQTKKITWVASSIRHQNFIDQRTGKEFIHIPAGEFMFGHEKKKLYLDEFWMAKTPVTNAEYKRFLDANPNYDVPFVDKDSAMPYNWDRQRRTFPEGKAEHPVVLVSLHDARAYAKWAGMQLPTEQQWEKAARGTDGKDYPWGNGWHENYCNTAESGIGETTPVGQFSPQGDSAFGCVDMAGNVWEWTNSLYKKSSEGRSVRGGSWLFSQNNVSTANRNNIFPEIRLHYHGFRVVVCRSPSQ